MNRMLRVYGRTGMLMLSVAVSIAPNPAQETAEPSADTAVAVEVAPEAVIPRADLGAANEAVRAGDYEKADAALATVLAEFPDDDAALLMRGEVLLALGKPAESRPFLERCIAVDPKRERANFQLASVLQATGELDAALEHYGKEIEVNDNDDVKIMAHLNRSILFEQQNKLDLAAAELESVLATDPDRPRIYGDLATLYIQIGRLDDASATLERGFDEGGFASANHYYILGSRFYMNGAYDKAVSAFSEALDLQDGYADAERSIGAALDQLGREAEAVKHLKRYLELRPDAAEADDIRKRIEAFESRKS